MKDTIVFTFGRFNPPTTGHEKLIEKVASVAKRKNADFMIFPSQTTNPKKDPLDFSTKVKYMKKMFPKYSRNIIKNTKVKTAFHIASLMYDMGYKTAIMVVGGDRVTEFDTRLNRYNGEKGPHGFYDFEDGIKVISAGDRDPDSEGVSGMSASKMRAAAVANDFEKFKGGLPDSFKGGEKLFSDIRKGMNINEDHMIANMFASDIVSLNAFMDSKIPELVEDLEEDELLGFMKEQFDMTFSDKQIDSVLESYSTNERILNRGAYAAALDALKTVIDRKKKESGSKGLRHGLSYYSASIAQTYKGVDGRKLEKDYRKAFPESVQLFSEVSQDKDIEDKKGSQPAKYYAKDADGDDMSVSTKEKRAAHFAKGNSKKPAPGDASAKTKPSKHTDKYKKMFGEKLSPKQKKIDKNKNGKIDGSDLAALRKETADDYEDHLALKDMSIEEQIEGLKKKSEKSKIPYGILKKVYDRGMAAWKGGHRPGTTAQQWAFARVNSFITKGKGTWGKADSDLAAKVRGESVESTDESVDEGFMDTMKQLVPGAKGKPAKGKPAKKLNAEQVKISKQIDKKLKLVDGLMQKVKPLGGQISGLMAFRKLPIEKMTPKDLYRVLNDWYKSVEGELDYGDDSVVLSKKYGRSVEDLHERMEELALKIKDYMYASGYDVPHGGAKFQYKWLNKVDFSAPKRTDAKWLKMNESVSGADNQPFVSKAGAGEFGSITARKKYAKDTPQAEEVTPKQINDLEKFADKLLAKYKIDVTFTRHFVDRMNDTRNSPDIKIAELQKLFKKIQKNKGKNILSNPDIEAVLKDMTADLNLPVVINYNNGEFELVTKTIMRKKNFSTSSKELRYEEWKRTLFP
jgi:hypothetical protein